MIVKVRVVDRVFWLLGICGSGWLVMGKMGVGLIRVLFDLDKKESERVGE